MSKVMVTTTLCLMLGQHLRLWINTSAGSSFLLVCSLSQYDTLTQYWFTAGPSFATQAQHYENIVPVYTYPVYSVGLTMMD